MPLRRDSLIVFLQTAIPRYAASSQISHFDSAVKGTTVPRHHQLKALRADLGVRLFHRLTRRLALTDGCGALYAVVGDAFERIAATADRLRVPGSGGTLTVSLGPYIAAAWLSPRIGRFWRRHPKIELHLHHTIEPVDFRNSAIDLAIDWGGGGDWPGSRPSCCCACARRRCAAPPCSTDRIPCARPATSCTRRCCTRPATRAGRRGRRG